MVIVLTLPQFAFIPIPRDSCGQTLECSADLPQRLAGFPRGNERMKMVRHQAIAIQPKGLFFPEFQQTLYGSRCKFFVLKSSSSIANNDCDEVNVVCRVIESAQADRLLPRKGAVFHRRVRLQINTLLFISFAHGQPQGLPLRPGPTHTPPPRRPDQSPSSSRPILPRRGRRCLRRAFGRSIAEGNRDQDSRIPPRSRSGLSV